MPTALLNDVNIAYDDTGTGEAVVLVHGHPFNRSMWAPQIEAITQSRRRAALVLAETFTDAETASGRTDRMVTADDLVRNGMSRYGADTISKMVGPTTMINRPAVVEHVTTMMLATSPVGAAAALPGRALRREYATTLEALSIPALVVVGSDDEFTPVADAERMHHLIADCRLVVIEVRTVERAMSRFERRSAIHSSRCTGCHCHGYRSACA